jgi:hypothetical protein
MTTKLAISSGSRSCTPAGYCIIWLSGGVRSRGCRAWCSDLLVLETCVSFFGCRGGGQSTAAPSQSVRGLGCRPTRRWVIEVLHSQFPHVYVPETQLWHEEFALDWSQPALSGRLARAVLIASRRPIENPLLVKEPPDRQTHAGSGSCRARHPSSTARRATPPRSGREGPGQNQIKDRRPTHSLCHRRATACF